MLFQFRRKQQTQIVIKGNQSGIKSRIMQAIKAETISDIQTSFGMRAPWENV